MRRLLRIASLIDRFTERTGRLVIWLTLFMVLIGAFNAIARYLDRYTGLGLSSNTYIELQWYMFSAIFLLAAAYTLKHNAHVRVDVLYGRLSRRGQAWINVAGSLLFLLPFCVLMIASAWPVVQDSWMRLEDSPDPGGLPRYPIKSLVPLAFVLLAVQGCSWLIKEIAVVRGIEGAHDEASRQDLGDAI